MKTLTDMLKPALERETDPVVGDWLTPIVKDIFKDWLKTVGLPEYLDLDGHNTNATSRTRQLLITLVDEP